MAVGELTEEELSLARTSPRSTDLQLTLPAGSVSVLFVLYLYLD